MTRALIELKNVNMKYTMSTGNTVTALDQFNFEIRSGEIVALVGASGVGKTSVMRIIAGLQTPTSGEVLFNGDFVDGVNTDVGVVFQDVTLYPWLTVAENVEFGLFPKGYNLRTRRQRVAKAIDAVGLEGFEEAYPRELSGGMKQRVSIARALAMTPKIVCLDEPFSALDVMTAETLRGEVLDIWQAEGSELKGILLITHDIVEAVYLADRVVVIGDPPISVKADIPVRLPHPRDEDSVPFTRLVRQIHSVFTEQILSDRPARTHAEEQALWVIPQVSIPDVIGLTELLLDEDGQLDVFLLPELMEKDFGDALLAVKAAELMNFVDTPHHKVLLTPLGEKIADGDVNERKEVIRTQLQDLRLVKMLIELLQNQEAAELPYDELIAWLRSKSPALDPKATLDTVIDWGRYGEIFRYNSDTAIVSLDEEPTGI